MMYKEKREKRTGARNWLMNLVIAIATALTSMMAAVLITLATIAMQNPGVPLSSVSFLPYTALAETLWLVLQIIFTTIVLQIRSQER